MGRKTKRYCEICKVNEGKINVVQFVCGKRKELFVCKDCALVAGINEQLEQVTLELESSRALEHVCPQCKWRLRDIIETGMLGCAYCYHEFIEEVRPIVEHFHGKKSFSAEEQTDNQKKLFALQWQLRKAVDEERFEEAANFRDMIKKFEKSKYHEG